LKVNVKAEVTFTEVSAPTAKLEASVSDADDAPTEKTPKRKSRRKKKTKVRRRS
jgi:hypothetical protein